MPEVIIALYFLEAFAILLEGLGTEDVMKQWSSSAIVNSIRLERKGRLGEIRGEDQSETYLMYIHAV